MKQKLFLILIVLVLNAGAFGQNQIIFKEFQDPDKTFTIAPLWSWNGTLIPNELKRQIDLMIDKGVYGAFMHARSGIDEGKTPYFSDGWWEAMDTTITYAARKGFYSWLYDEDAWPSGTAGGRTIAVNPKEFIKKGLQYDIVYLKEGEKYKIDTQGKIKIFAVKMTGENSFDPISKIDLTNYQDNNWTTPQGNWSVLTFKLTDYRVPPNTSIDYLNEKAVKAFINITHEEYYKRYGKFFGKSIPGIFFDEISFSGARSGKYLPWTEDFAEAFKKRQKYDILDVLPSLVLESPGSDSLNCGYFEELTYRYDHAWFKQIADWCDLHKIGLTGHTEESFDNYKKEGNYFQTIGRMQFPGTDNEDFRYNYPKYINWFKPKQLSSVAHVHGRKTSAVEAMGVGGYIITPEEYKYGFANLGVYGINFFIPHLFHYSDSLLNAYMDCPPSWFFKNPYWKYFKPLADYGRRISYMNRTGDHVCHVALFWPITEQWAKGFNGVVDDRDYNMVQEMLLDHQIDYDIINPESLLNSDCSAGTIKIYKENYKVLILPSISTITLETAKQLEKFYDNGGVVLALNKIPLIAIKGDAKELNRIMYKIFGIQSNAVGIYYDVEETTFKPYTTSRNKNGGKGCFTKRILELPDILRENITNEIEVVDGNVGALRATQYKKDKLRYYMLVNEERQPNHFQIQTPDYGIPYKLDIESGESVKVENYISKDGKLLFSFDFKPWEAFYLLFEEGKSASRNVMIASNTLDGAKLKVSNDKLIVSGWADPRKDNYYTLKYSNGAESKSEIKIADALSPITIGDDWTFQAVDKQLDDKWTDKVKESVIDIPVMRFYANLDNKKWDLSSSGFDDSHLPEVKMMDRFSGIKGAKRYLSEWNASRIIGYETIVHITPFEGRNVTFRKVFELNDPVQKSIFKISAEPSYTLFVNGVRVGSNSNIAEVLTYDIAPYLRKGKNEIIVEVPRQIGLIAEGSIETNTDFIILNTDDSWEAELNGIWRDAVVHSKPSLNSWKDINFSTKDIVFPVECWYRQQLPTGAAELILPKRSGSFTYYLNGKILKEHNGKIELSKVKDSGKQILAIKAVLNNYNDGLLAPVKAVCREVNIKLASWRDLGLNWFSGRAIYKNEFDFSYDIDSNKYRFILDPGDVKWFSEIWVNGKLVKYSPFGDHKADISEFIKKGKNKISIIVSNLRANETIWEMPDQSLIEKAEDTKNWNRWCQQGATLREKGKLESGLLGPVRLIPIKYVEWKDKFNNFNN